MSEQDERRCPCGKCVYESCWYVTIFRGMYGQVVVTSSTDGKRRCHFCFAELRDDGTHGLSYAQLEAQVLVLAELLVEESWADTTVENWLQWSIERMAEKAEV